MKHAITMVTALLFATIVAVSQSQAQVVTPIPPIRIDSGMLSGKVLASGVKTWLGIPYVKPPVGELRWKEPQPITWEGVYNADRKMPECTQVLRAHNINHYFGEEATCEDCLYMNIWAPSDAEADSGLPVIVFIYGGGMTVGSSGMAIYDGEQVARRGAVFVNFNYRIGILGFMAHPELTREAGGHSGNYGFLDQNAALKWIQRNIAKFGGDPKKVVISGQSAGAGSVVEQIFSPLSKGLFRGAVMMSGCNWDRENETLATAEKTGLEIQKLLKADNIDGMRQVPSDRILALQAERQLGVSVSGVRVGGVIDGYFMPKTKAEILASHEINDVPIIASFTRDEAANAMSRAGTVTEYEEAVRQAYGSSAAEFLKLYPVTTAADIREMGGASAREGGNLLNACNCAALQDEHNTSQAFITMFSRVHSYAPGVKIADQDTTTIGAYHTSDVPFWFGTLDAFNMFRTTRNWTSWDRELSQKMTAALIAFANTGNPSTSDLKWPVWTALNEQLVNFGDRITIEKINRERLDFLSAHPTQAGPFAPGPGAPRD